MIGPTKSYYPKSMSLCFFFLYWISVEWVFFQNPADFGGTAFTCLSYIMKFFLPMILLAIARVPSFGVLNRNAGLGLYVLFFFAMIVWSTIPSVLLSFENLFEVIKKIPPFLFFLAVISLFMKNPGVIRSVAKLIVGIVLFALAQYICVYVFNIKNTSPSIESGLVFAGPFGLFGNITSMRSVAGLDFQINKLTGFWSEPSNASGIAFSAFFLARYLFMFEHNRLWKNASYCCLAAGLLCLSNAGYLSLGIALLFGAFATPKKLTLQRVAVLFAYVALSTLLVFAALFGRSYVVTNYPEVALLKALLNVPQYQTEYVDRDVEYGGRISLATKSLDAIKDNPIGMGLQTVGTQGIEASASAPIYWLYLTGIPGLILLLLREATLLFTAGYLIKRIPSSIPLVQAWLVILVQHLSYGTWMNPSYLTLAAIILSMAATARTESGHLLSD